ncbi:MAG: YraN family protein [Filifactoraceae bacterium]
MLNNVKKGILGENIGSDYLLKNGHCILDRNFRTKHGEIDIITKKRCNIHFIEVKLRKNRDYGNASDAVNYIKQKKIRIVAGEFLREKKIFYNEINFDVLEIYTDEKFINYIENAF